MNYYRLFIMSTSSWLGSLFLLGNCLAIEQKVDAQAAFAAMINDHALTMGMLCGERRVQGKNITRCGIGSNDKLSKSLKSGEKVTCTVRIVDSNELTEENKKYSAIHREIQRSSLPLEVARFNKPNSPADRALFELNEETCEIRRYLGVQRNFRVPVKHAAQELKVSYAVDDESGEAIVIRLPRRTNNIVRIPVQPIATTENVPRVLDLLRMGPVPKPLKSGILEIRYNGNNVAVWDRRNKLSTIQIQRTAIKVRLNYPKGIVGLNDENTNDTQLGQASKIFFPFGATLTLRAKEDKKGRTIFRNIATIEHHSSANKPLFQQKANGQVLWGKTPTNFETQIIEAFRNTQGKLKADVKLTINPYISRDLTMQLSDSMENLKIKIRDEGPPRRVPYYGSVAMLDAISGEVVGIASYPRQPDPISYPGGEFKSSPGMEEVLRRRVIGSVAKVPLSFAILAARPELHSMTIPYYSSNEIEKVLGRDLEKNIADGHPPNTNCGLEVGLRCYIKLSLNKFAVTLMAMGALGSDAQFEGGTIPLGKDTVKVNGTEISNQPPQFVFRENNTSVGIELPFSIKLNEFFDIRSRFDKGGRAENHNYMWRNELKQGNPSDFSAFAMIAPERENFELNLIKSYRDYLTLILGGGESRWSGVKVAETYARLVSGTKLKASFVKTKQGGAPPSLFGESTGGITDAHKTILDGMSDVIDMPNGTGNWLQKSKKGLEKLARDAGYQLKMYAKTGTPRIDATPNQTRQKQIQDLRSLGVIDILKRGANGHIFTYSDKTEITERSIANYQQGKIPRDLINFFVDFNGLEKVTDQESLCKFPGRDVICGDVIPEATTVNDGRNLALVVQLWRDETLCRAVSIAFSHSAKPKKSDDKIWRKLINDTLAIEGAVAQYLLREESTKSMAKECGNAN